MRSVPLRSSRPFGGAGSGQADDDRDFDVEGLGAFDDAARDFVAAGDAAEDVEQDTLDVGVGKHEFEAVLDQLGFGAAADVEEVGGRAARALDFVHRAHDETRAVADDADVAVEVDVVIDAPASRFLLEGVGLFAGFGEGGEFRDGGRVRCRR